MRAGAVPLLLELVTSSTFLAGAHLVTRKAAYLALLRLLKFRLGVVGHSLLFTVVEAQLPTSNTKIRVLLSPLTSLLPPLSQLSNQTLNHAVMLQLGKQGKASREKSCLLLDIVQKGRGGSNPNPKVFG